MDFNARPAEDVATHESWIEAAEYLTLALSSRKLLRCDRPSEGILGLIDPHTGIRYCVHAESFRQTPISRDAE